ncbi:MAG: ribosomal RNA small subunit methyltransferase A [Parcubacteria group bacterium]|nr:ribosomal RNA small subunit methyltransferase A [Parcubacteria group bacterium]
MNLASPNTVRALLAKYGLRPEKRLGQHFLVRSAVIKTLVDAAGITKDDTVVEIGPGIGVITQELAQRARSVYAIERDRRFIPILEETLKSHTNVTHVFQDARRVEPAALPSKTYRIVSSLPYYAGTALIRHFLETSHPPQSMTVVVQREVALRIVAQPPHATLLGNSVQFFGIPRLVCSIPASAFWPEPEIDSALIDIRNIHNRIRSDPHLAHAFFLLLTSTFHHPRKQALPSLARTLGKTNAETRRLLTALGYTLTVRPQEITIDGWIACAKEIG